MPSFNAPPCGDHEPAEASAAGATDQVGDGAVPLAANRYNSLRSHTAQPSGLNSIRRGNANMATPWPDKPCPSCGKTITDLLMLQRNELEFLSAWAREEKAVDPYVLPAHQLQAAHQVRGVTLIRAIKAWSCAEGRTEEDIFNLYDNPAPSWPWSSEEEMTERLTGRSATETEPLDGYLGANADV